MADQATFDQLPTDAFDAALHLAAQSSGEASFDDAVADARTNVLGTIRLLEWCARRGVRRVLYASSMAVYGNAPSSPVQEDAPCAPTSFYGASKLAAEQYVRIFTQSGMQATVIRMFSVYGPGQDLANIKQGMVSIFLAPVLRGDPILVRGSKDRKRDFVYVDDVVRAWMLALERPKAGVYNIGSGNATSVDQLLQEVLRATGHDENYDVRCGVPTPGDQHALHADITRARTELGWEPKTQLREGLASMVASYRPSS